MREHAAREPDGSGGPSTKVPRAVAAEAAVWVARLHGPDRSPEMERECLAWQARSATHRLAFERCTDTWESIPRVTVATAYAAADARQHSWGAYLRQRRVALQLVGLALLVCAATLVFQHWSDADVYATAVGEQRFVMLADGTRMSLNTNSRVRVQMQRERRIVVVQAGEAMFDVAKDPARPFAVRAAGNEVVAVGTVFSVKLGAPASPAHEALAVTLIEGQVTVQPVSMSSADDASIDRTVVMHAGERVRVLRAASAGASRPTVELDRPRIGPLTAWRRSEAEFDDVALPDAVAEMNRYSRTPIVLVDEKALSRLRVSGAYRTGDSAGFARAVAELHGLTLREREGRLELALTQ